MTDQEFENIIRKTLHIDMTPSRDSLLYTLSQLKTDVVTKNSKLRYNTKTVMSSIINNLIDKINNISRTKHIIMIPGFILIFFLVMFSLSPHNNEQYNNKILQNIAEQDETIEELGNDTDDDIILTSFDSPAINDLALIKDEL